ncbi:hypothetical protein M5D96_008797 [Drosophila gunungcola]|uniref:Uncharacterized protein n=1 Tax=Drosophila gunungcola TaxID=103775 RepID=A0A9Q0BPD5_9MUSC|nr:hypothetical protein M5D96_008797 [Drosophila gunungcola]
MAANNLRQIPLTCSGHTRPVVHLDFSDICDSGYFLISACKAASLHCSNLPGNCSSLPPDPDADSDPAERCGAVQVT